MRRWPIRRRAVVGGWRAVRLLAVLQWECLPSISWTLARLGNGMAELEKKDPDLAGRIRTRARATVAKLYADFPGDPATGVLAEAETDEDSKRWDDFANDVPCPALHPENGTCEIYEYLDPVLCRTFGASW